MEKNIAKGFPLRVRHVWVGYPIGAQGGGSLIGAQGGGSG